jgi:hypothetical protein
MDSFETLAFHRGVATGEAPMTPLIVNPRKDRLPKNTPLEVHERADKWFETKFGVRYRSQAVFVTSKEFIAAAYAASPQHVVRVIPLGDYRYCWSPKVYDFLAASIDPSNAKDIEGFLDRSGYIESDLRAAHAAGYEVMIFCERYVAIPLSLLKEERTGDVRIIL